jgi:hypothetical protein
MNRRIIILLAFALFGLGSYLATRQSASNRLGLAGDNNESTLKVPPTAASNDTVSNTQSLPATNLISGDPNVPIELWARVVDQEGAPIAGAEISFCVRSWPFIRRHVLLEGKFEQARTVSDPNGDFSIRNFRGDSLTIESITKPGFKLASKRHLGFEFYKSGFRSNPEKPRIFTMLADGIGVAERLTEFRFHTRIPYDGTPTAFDVNGTKLEGEEITGGDIRVILERFPRQIPLGSRDFDWRARIEVVNGGLVTHNSRLDRMAEEDFSTMYLASEAGYVPSYEIAMDRTDPNWSERKALSFFFCNRNGRHYGRAVLEINADYNQEKTGFSLMGAVNPTGSRNLRRARP